MIKTTFSTEIRKLMGKKAGQLRNKLLVPGNVYGSSGSVSLQFPEKEFNKLYDEVGDTGLIYLQVKGKQKEKPTLIDEVQIDPVSGKTLHVSFKEVDLKEKIQAEVQIELVGEFDIREAVMVQVKNSIIVEALPTDLPEKFEINIESLTEVGQSITLADLDFDKSKVSLVEVENDEDWENPVVLVQEQREEEVEEVVEAVGVEGVAEEGVGEGEKGEGGKDGGEKISLEGGGEKGREKTGEKKPQGVAAEKKED